MENYHAEVLGNMALYFMLNLPKPEKYPLVIKTRKQESELLKTIKATVAAEGIISDKFKPKDGLF